MYGCVLFCVTSAHLTTAKWKRGDQYRKVTSLLIRKQNIYRCTTMKGQHLQMKERWEGFCDFFGGGGNFNCCCKAIWWQVLGTSVYLFCFVSCSSLLSILTWPHDPVKNCIYLLQLLSFLVQRVQSGFSLVFALLPVSLLCVLNFGSWAHVTAWKWPWQGQEVPKFPLQCRG